MKTKIHHMALSVKGALRNFTKKDWDTIGADNNMTGNAVKEKFRIMEFEGIKVVPMSGDKCEGWSDETGCQGHEQKGESE